MGHVRRITDLPLRVAMKYRHEEDEAQEKVKGPIVCFLQNW
jgi:hypothetical protein